MSQRACMAASAEPRLWNDRFGLSSCHLMVASERLFVIAASAVEKAAFGRFGHQTSACAYRLAISSCLNLQIDINILGALVIKVRIYCGPGVPTAVMRASDRLMACPVCLDTRGS